jgi:hypothetical protein
MHPASAGEHSWLYLPSLSPSRWLGPALRPGATERSTVYTDLGCFTFLGFVTTCS